MFQDKKIGRESCEDEKDSGKGLIIFPNRSRLGGNAAKGAVFTGDFHGRHSLTTIVGSALAALDRRKTKRTDDEGSF